MKKYGLNNILLERDDIVIAVEDKRNFIVGTIITAKSGKHKGEKSVTDRRFYSDLPNAIRCMVKLLSRDAEDLAEYVKRIEDTWQDLKKTMNLMEEDKTFGSQRELLNKA